MSWKSDLSERWWFVSRRYVNSVTKASLSLHLCCVPVLQTRGDMTVHFLQSSFSSFSPLALFYSCSSMCVCGCVLCPFHLYRPFLCVHQQKLIPFYPLISTYTLLQSDQASSTWSQCCSVCMYVCMCVCVSHPLHAVWSLSDYTDGRETQSRR